jgi:single-stranded DNA-specific DHH superfamily exonuclease
MENEISKIFGIRAVIEAINAGQTISKVYLQKDLSGPLFSELNSLIKQHTAFRYLINRLFLNESNLIEKYNDINTKKTFISTALRNQINKQSSY